MSTQALASFMPDDKPQQNVVDSTTGVVSTTGSTSEDKSPKQKSIVSSISTKILATCTPDNVSTKDDVNCSAQQCATDRQSINSDSLFTESRKNVKKSSSSSLRLSTPSQKLASSLGLDLSSSSSSGESSDEDQKSSKKTKSPKKLSTVEQPQRGAKPAKKKVQLGHSTKENQVDFVFRN